ncbi:hypothetical protein MAALD49_21540 [Marinobacter shengliensis]|nr:hypothetical protein MAALD49_21540 [Marinobacter shengliensis]
MRILAGSTVGCAAAVGTSEHSDDDPEGERPEGPNNPSLSANMKPQQECWGFLFLYPPLIGFPESP